MAYRKKVPIVNKTTCPYCKREVTKDGECDCDLINRVPIHSVETQFCVKHGSHVHTTDVDCQHKNATNGLVGCTLIPARIVYAWEYPQ